MIIPHLFRRWNTKSQFCALPGLIASEDLFEGFYEVLTPQFILIFLLSSLAKRLNPLLLLWLQHRFCLGLRNSSLVLLFRIFPIAQLRLELGLIRPFNALDRLTEDHLT